MKNKQEKIVEIWRDVVGYEGSYQVSNLGRVKSVERVVMRKNGRVQPVPERILKAYVGNHGYFVVRLCNDNKIKHCLVHRLVAQAFIPNTNNLPQVNHIDENPQNNRLENLEWCDAAYNINYGTRTERTSKKVAQISRETGEVVRIWQSTNEVARQLGYSIGAISECANGKRNAHTAYGFKWSYIN